MTENEFDSWLAVGSFVLGLVVAFAWMYRG
jgi:hypothetical protein